MLFDFQEELKKLPHKPGVYIMRYDRDVILYVGKAIDLPRCQRGDLLALRALLFSGKYRQRACY